ncbi:hypothetical protein [Marinicrinis lubricantis]|uniref:Uncharacterized protein n=1 Tax=Marinicrinis lubricantis TaxID=2086470 RepID=A0ABW1IV49_9BACL
MTEKNILAYFNTPEEAEGVARKLKALRALDVSIDRFSRYPGEGVQRNMNPITGDFAGLGNLTLDADYSNKSAAILSAADPSASGMSDGGQGGPTGKDILLTAVMPEETFHQALEVCRQAGAQL